MFYLFRYFTQQMLPASPLQNHQRPHGQAQLVTHCNPDTSCAEIERQKPTRMLGL
jgi:hypothetical protein